MARSKSLSEMTPEELQDVLNREAEAAAKASRAHLLRAWEAAVRLGDRGAFIDWLPLALVDALGDEARTYRRFGPHGGTRHFSVLALCPQRIAGCCSDQSGIGKRTTRRCPRQE